MSLTTLLLPTLLLALIQLVSAVDPDLVAVVSRHGARGPVNNQWDNSWNDNEYNQLTNTGIRQHYLLGKVLAKKYASTLQSYGPNTIYLRAHSQNRTVQSLYAQTLGLFPPGKGPVLPNGTIALDGQIQPIPVHSVNTSVDWLLNPHSPTTCPYETILARNESEPEAMEMKSRVQPTLDRLNALYNRTLNVGELSVIFDTLECDQYANRSFPPELSFFQPGNEYWRNLSYLHDWWFMYKDYKTLEQQQLFSTNLLHELTSKLYSYLYLKPNANQTFLSYVGHDGSLAPTLAMYNLTTYDCITQVFLNQSNKSVSEVCYAPRFASSMRFELYKRPNLSESYMRFYYDNIEINLCASGTTPCTFDLFNQTVENLTNGISLNNYWSQCWSAEAQFVDHSSNYFTALWALLGANILLVIGLIITCIYKHKANSPKAYDDHYKQVYDVDPKQ